MKHTAHSEVEASPRLRLARILAMLLLCAASVFAAGCCDDDDDDDVAPFVSVTPTTFQFSANFNAESFEQYYTWDTTITFAPIVEVHIDNFWYGDFVIEVFDNNGDLLQPRIHLFTGGGIIIIDGELDDTIRLDAGEPGRWVVHVYVNGMDGDVDFLIH